MAMGRRMKPGASLTYGWNLLRWTRARNVLHSRSYIHERHLHRGRHLRATVNRQRRRGDGSALAYVIVSPPSSGGASLYLNPQAGLTSGWIQSPVNNAAVSGQVPITSSLGSRW